MTDITNNLKLKLKQIKLLVLDVDGVLTNGGIYINEDGSESLRFNVKDGLGLKLLLNNHVEIAIITGRKSAAVSKRCQALSIEHIYQGILDKGKALVQLQKETQVLKTDEIAFIGDDLPDLLVLHQVGVGIAVNDAHELVREAADYICHSKGGFGAVREVCELILISKGFWPQIEKKYQ